MVAKLSGFIYLFIYIVSSLVSGFLFGCLFSFFFYIFMTETLKYLYNLKILMYLH